jgi:hypothetical protein
MALPKNCVIWVVPPLILGWAVLAATGFNPDPTDPANVAPITLVNDTATAADVRWCSSDGSNACTEEDDLGRVPAGTTRQVHISSYEVMIHVEGTTGPGRFACEDNAPGSRMSLRASYPSMKSAYDHCSDGDSPGDSADP